MTTAALIVVMALTVSLSCSSTSVSQGWRDAGGTNADASAGTGGGGAPAFGGSGGNVGGFGGSATGAAGSTAGAGGLAGEAPCDTNEKTETAAIFVSSTGLDTNNGKADFPVQTLSKALALAKANFATHIYLAVGDYTLDQTLSLGAAEGGIVIEGGWTKSGPNWAPDCTAGRRAFTTLAVGSAIAVRVQDTSKAVALRHLKISTKAQADTPSPGQPGQSMIGVWVSGVTSAFSLYDVEIISGDAGTGGPAITPTAPGTAACDGHNGCCTTEPACGDATNGPTAPVKPTSAGSDAASSGMFDQSGYVAANGEPGLSGGNGYNGKAGAAGENKGYVCVGVPGCCGWCSGGSCMGASTCGSSTLLKAEDGRCGCGGLGGLGAMGGRGGGASVALLATDGATVTVEYSSLHAGNGGNGELGGAGGPGAPGSDGQKGTDMSCDTSCNGACPNCANNTSAIGGGAGTKGGYGAIGGDAGAGAGGPSHSYVAASATVTDNGNNSFTFGLGGKGANNAASGQAGIKP